ncbi:MAG: NAD-dependent DNA ligase LigA [Rickettsiales bacterium]|jgi:DNA ligase (NAD+)|nr:NAD-dependent DNA ligase LigA [Rickettsiales bacterium]
MTKSEMKLRLKELAKLLEKYDRAYYEKDAPLVDDAAYDRLKDEALNLEKQLGSVDLFGVESNVGSKARGDFAKVAHTTPMLSLEKVYTMEELSDFVVRTRRDLGLLPLEKLTFVAEPKIDGLSFSARFEHGKFIQGATRGDGQIGEDITENLSTVQGFPSIVDPARAPGILEVRGEVFMSKDDFMTLNQELESKGEKTFANPRNAAAGSLRQLDARITKRRKLSYIVYAWGEVEPIEWTTQSGFYEYAKSLGFNVQPTFKLCNDADDLAAFFHEIELSRSHIPFDIDGVIYKVDSLELQAKLGSIARAPKWAVAHKFPPANAITRLEKISVQIGRTGVITPVADLEPVNIGGVIVARATLHNEDYIAANDIRVGDTVSIERAGDVIPQVVAVIKSERKNDAQPFKMPGNCPVCGTALVRKEGEAATRCPNLECPGRQKEYLKYFVSRDAFNIDGLGDRQVELFFEKGWIKTPADVFAALPKHASEMEKLEGFGRLSVSNLMDAIKRARRVPLDKLVYALGIIGIGSATSILLADSFKNLNALSAATFENLIEIRGIGDIMANDILAYFKDEKNLQNLSELAAELDILNPETHEVNRENPLFGKTIVFTGSLAKFTREQAQNLARTLGANPATSVSKRTDFVVAGGDAGTKLDDARKLGVNVISEDEFEKLANENA